MMIGFALPSSASSSFTYSLADCNYKWLRGGQEDFSSTVTYENATYSGRSCVLLYNTNPNAYKSGNAKFLTAMRISELRLDAEYQLSFDSIIDSAVTYSVFIYLCNASGEMLSSYIYMQQYKAEDNHARRFRHNEVNFTLENLGLVSNHNVYLAIEFVVPMDFGYNFKVGGSDVTLTNLDDDSGDILDWFSRIYHSIVGGEDSQGVPHEGIVQGIKNGLNNVRDSINNKIESIKNAISDKIESIKVSIEAKIEAIGEDIKNFFIPRDGYFEERFEIAKTWAAEHFGIVYTAGDLGITVLRQFTTLTPPSDPVLNVPAWQMRSPIDNKVITLVEESQIHFNDYTKEGTPLHSFYKFYKVFITVAIIFMVVNYARNKFDYVFGKDGEGVS